ncbi:MAG TPA: hypothetical protein VF549_11025 [Solirubrobacteraceae bacterium]|jgi:hypothetical protein
MAQGRAWLAGLIAVAALLVPIGVASAAVKPGVPSLRPSTVAAGGSVTAKVVLRNRASRKAKVRLDLLLSRDAKRNAADRRLRRARVTIKARRTKRASVRVVLPASTAAAQWRVLACVGRACRASSALVVTAAKPPAPPVMTPPSGGPAGFPNLAGDVVTEAPFSASGPFAPTLDTARAVTATLPVTGGTLNATDANGNAFQLTIPDGALLDQLEITMTPLASATGLPFSGGLVGGVQFAPDGLQLAEPATLTITPAQPVPLDRQSPFGWYGDDDLLHNALLDPDTGAIKLPITHFSGAGLGNGSMQDRINQAEKELGEGQADLYNRGSQILNESRANGSEIPREPLAALLREYHASVVKPTIQAALTDRTKAILAMRRALDFEKTAHLVDVQDLLKPEFLFDFRNLDEVLENHYDKSFQRCQAENKAEEGFMMWEDVRIRDVAWLWDSPTIIPEKIEKCLHFEFGVEGTITERFDDGISVPRINSVTVATPTRSVFSLGTFLAPTSRTFPRLDITAASSSEEYCTREWTGEPQTDEDLRVFVSSFRVNINLVGNDAPDIPELRVDLSPGSRKAEFTVTCEGEDAPPPYTVTEPTWYSGWRHTHAGPGEYIWNLQEGELWRVSNWAAVGQGTPHLWAQKVFHRTVQTAESTFYDEHIFLKLFHTPQPWP